MSIKSFVLDIDLLNVLDSMDDKQAGRLFKVIRAYWLREAERCQQDADTGYDELLNDFVTRLAFAPFQTYFDKYIQKHNAMVERNRENGRKGGAPKGNKNAKIKQPTGLKNNPKQPKQPSGLSGLNDDENTTKENGLTIHKTNELQENNPNNRVGCLVETDKSPLSNNINNINIYNNSKKIIKDNLKESSENLSLFPPVPPPKKKRQKTEFVPPTLEEVEQYFLLQGADSKLKDWKKQASIFFNHFDSIGWCTPNGAKIVHWDSKANLWILEKEKENEESTANKCNNGKQSGTTRHQINPDCGLIE